LLRCMSPLGTKGELRPSGNYGRNRRDFCRGSRPGRTRSVDPYSDNPSRLPFYSLSRYGETTSRVSLLRHDVKSSARAPPSKYPLLKQAEVVAFHELKTSSKIWFYPAIEVFEPIRQHSAALPQCLVCGQYVLVLETLDDHEKHCQFRCFVHKTTAGACKCHSRQKAWSGSSWHRAARL
jgi:hypothetical protein